MSFFAGFIDTSIPGYLFVIIAILLSRNEIKFTLGQYFVLFGAVAYFIFLIANADSLEVILKNLRYWYGIIIFILFFKTIARFKYFTITFFRVVCVTVILEFIALHFFAVWEIQKPLSKFFWQPGIGA